MQWRDFNYDGRVYDLSHLHPRIFRGPRDGETFDPLLIYPDDYEARIFDFRRYEMSKRLPEIIQGLPARKPRHNRSRGNYFSVELVAENGDTVEYDIFSRCGSRGRGGSK